MRSSWSEGALPRSVANVGQDIAVNLGVFVWMETADRIPHYYSCAEYWFDIIAFRRCEHSERRASFPDFLEILGEVIYSQSRERAYI